MNVRTRIYYYILHLTSINPLDIHLNSSITQNGLFERVSMKEKHKICKLSNLINEVQKENHGRYQGSDAARIRWLGPIR